MTNPPLRIIGIVMAASIWVGMAGFILAAIVTRDDDPWYWGAVVGLGCVIATTLIGMGMVLDRRPPAPPGEKQQVTKLAVTVTENGAPYAWGMFHDLPITSQQLTTIAKMLLRDPAFTHRRFVGVVLNDREFISLRDMWVEGGILMWDNPRSHTRGCKLSPVGRKIMQKLAEIE